MVGLQGLHTNDTSQCSNVSSSVGLKLFFPWCFKLGANTEMISTHLKEVHYWLAIVCDICKTFASMMVQLILEHHSGWKVKSQKKKSKVKEQEKPPKVISHGTNKSCRAERCLKPFCPILPMNEVALVILTLHSVWVPTQLYKLSCFGFNLSHSGLFATGCRVKLEVKTETRHRSSSCDLNLFTFISST